MRSRHRLTTPATGRRATPPRQFGRRQAHDWVALPLGDHALAESPRWEPVGSQLGWVDITGGTLHTATRDGGIWSTAQAHEPPGRPTSLEPVPETAGVWDVASSGRLVRLDLAGGHELASLEVAPRFPEVRTNDTLRDPAGRVLVGLFTEDRTSPHGGIVSVDPHLGSCRWVVTGMVTANGLGLNRAATRLYVVDTASAVVVRHHYDLRTGDVGPGVVLVRHQGPGKLDGLLVLDDDTVLVAAWDEGSVRRYDPDRGLLEVISAPVTRPTALAALPAPDAGIVLTTAVSGPVGEDVAASSGAGRDGGRLYWTGPFR